MIFENLYFTT